MAQTQSTRIERAIRAVMDADPQWWQHRQRAVWAMEREIRSRTACRPLRKCRPENLVAMDRAPEGDESRDGALCSVVRAGGRKRCFNSVFAGVRA